MLRNRRPAIAIARNMANITDTSLFLVTHYPYLIYSLLFVILNIFSYVIGDRCVERGHFGTPVRKRKAGMEVAPIGKK